MASLNKMTLIGHLGRDPESRQVGDKAVCNFSVGVSDAFAAKSGEKKEETEWFNVAIWDKRGEACQKFLKKGSPVYVEGKIHLRKYVKDGAEKFSLDVLANNVQFLGTKQDGASSAPSKSSTTFTSTGSRQTESLEDIPF